MIASVFVLQCVTFLIGAVGLVGYRAHVRAAAIDFVQEAAQRVYGDQDRDWLVRHSTREAVSERAGVITVFDEAARFMGPVRQISATTGEARVFYRFPATFLSNADMVADGESAFGHACLYFAIVDLGSGWQVQWTWWEHSGTPTGVCKSVHPLQPRTLSAR
jgi:hypothetical protein